MGPEGTFYLSITLMLTQFILPCIDELEAAVDEMKKNDKDEKRLAMAAKSLMEHMEEIQNELATAETRAESAEDEAQRINSLNEMVKVELETALRQKEQHDLIREDLNKNSRNLEDKHKKVEKKLHEIQRKYTQLEDEASRKDQKYADLESKTNIEQQDLSSQLANLQMHFNNTTDTLSRVQANSDESEKQLQQLTQREKQMMRELQKQESNINSMTRKYEKAKKYVRELEDEIVKKESKIKTMEMQKKNEELCSQLESTAGGLAGELGELDPGSNMMGHMDDGLEPERVDEVYDEDQLDDPMYRNSLVALE